MRVSPKQIEQMAAAVVAGLLEKGHVTAKVTRDSLEAAVRQTLSEDLAAEEALDQEVERMLAPHADKMNEEGADYRKMFSLLKHKLARERGIVL